LRLFDTFGFVGNSVRSKQVHFSRLSGGVKKPGQSLNGLFVLSCIFGWAVVFAGPTAALPQETNPPAKPDFEHIISPFVAQNCAMCHNEKLKTAGLNLQGYRDTASMLKDRAVWEKVVTRLQAGEMPPKGLPRPKPEDIAAVTGWINEQFSVADQNMKPDPGHLTAHRLNRAEYNNTIRDLLAVQFKPAADFPADDSGYGFDNIGDVLTVSPVLTEKYLAVAEKIAVQAIPLAKKNGAAVQTTESYKRIFICGHAPGHHDQQCLRTNLAHLARLAYRRPVTDEEIKRLTKLVAKARKEHMTYEQAMRIGVEAILVSPHFLYRIERDPEPADASHPQPVSDYELASRLSYFLWSSMPDEELLNLADQRRLNDPTTLEVQARRMLKDPKSEALVDNFAGQWLELRNLDLVHPDRKAFPEWNPSLQKAMATETKMFVQSIFQEDRSIMDFLDGTYTFLNERLANFYGIPNVKGDEFRRVSLDGTQRSGVLTQASILTVTSYPTRTSPVLRGKWILENVLNTPPPPPPPGVGSLDTKGAALTGTMRQQLEKHRANPMCAGCHTRMDPLGFALENYNAIGQWRTHEGQFLVDSTGVLPNGKKFSGSAELKTLLMSNRDGFAECLTEKMLTYALGRGLEDYDRPATKKITRALAANDYKFSSLVIGIVQSLPFQMGRGEGAPTGIQQTAEAKTR
jgi:mono/diheme cytochrome c family protein